jgi:hypothetical protein
MLRYSSKQFYRFFTFFIFVSITVAGVLAYQIKNGKQFDVDKYIQTVENSSSLENLKVRIKEVEDGFHAYRARETYQDIKNIQMRVNKVLKVNNSYQDEINYKAKNSLDSEYDKLVSLPALNELMRVFQNRMKKYYEFVIQNRWPTLTRITRKMMDRFEGVLQKNKSNYNYQLIRSSLKLIKSEINQLEMVTNRSRLKDFEKKSILRRTEPMKQELQQIISYLVRFNKFSKGTTTYFKSLQSWAGKTAPELEREKIEFHSEANSYFYYMLGFIALCFAFFGIGTLLFKKEEDINRDNSQRSIVEMIRNEVINENFKGQSVVDDEEFREDLYELQSYCQKRMKLGKVLNVTSPFPMFILDHSLNITWANQHFRNLFSLNANFEITWDYFRKNTNLGDSDPIDAAIKKQVAGIYQIQLRTIQDEQPMPFEIYVSPTNEYDEKRVVVWFYPLQSLQDTLTDQAKSIVGPVSRMLDNLVADQYSKEFEQSIKSDFNIAGIENLFDKFRTYTNKIDIQKAQLLGYIDSLEDEITGLTTGLGSFNESIKQFDEHNREVSKFVSKVKNNFVKIINHNEKIHDLERNMYHLSEKHYALMNESHEDLKNFADFKQSMHKFESSLGEMRESQKGAIEYVSLIKLLFKKVAKGVNVNPEMSEHFQEMNEKLGMIEKSFLKGQKSCDVLISKLDILMSGLPKEESLSRMNNYSNLFDDVKMKNMDFNAINSSIFDIADHTVENFKLMVQLLSATMRDSNELITNVDRLIVGQQEHHQKLQASSPFIQK